MDSIEHLGQLIETMPKAAGFYEISKGKPLTAEQKSYIRRYIGSPDFMAGGYLKSVSNEIFLFSNAIAQGLRSDIEIATNPKTRSGYWWKTAKLNLLPKLLMLAAGLGLFGATIKKIMNDASEYDKSNYTIIPLGTDENQNSIYLRIPEDEAGRLMGGILWKALNLANSQTHRPIGQDLSDIFAFMGGQVPNLSPAITTTSAIFDYLSEIIPMILSVAAKSISDDAFKARRHESKQGIRRLDIQSARRRHLLSLRS